VFAQRVTGHFPLLPAEDEGRLNDPVAPRGVHRMNTLQHAFGHIGRELDRGRRADLSARIESFRHGTDPLSVPVAILAHYASDGTLPWLAGQTYLQPYPALLRLRHAVPR
jgi:uncharacterized protein YbgA (DUF1722 family)